MIKKKQRPGKLTCVDWNNTGKVGDGAQDKLVVGKDNRQVRELDLVRLVGISNILVDSALKVLALVVGEPLCVFWPIWKEKVTDDTNDAGHGTLNDEDPSPWSVSSGIYMSQTVSQEATEGTGNSSREEEEGETLLRSMARIPHGENVESSWEDSGFEYTEQDSSDKEMGILLDESLTEGD